MKADLTSPRSARSCLLIKSSCFSLQHQHRPTVPQSAQPQAQSFHACARQLHHALLNIVGVQKKLCFKCGTCYNTATQQLITSTSAELALLNLFSSTGAAAHALQELPSRPSQVHENRLACMKTDIHVQCHPACSIGPWPTSAHITQL
jgi:hypothetical protein